MWIREQPLILDHASVNEGQGIITSVEHSGCDSSVFPGRYSLVIFQLSMLYFLFVCFSV